MNHKTFSLMIAMVLVLSSCSEPAPKARTVAKTCEDKGATSKTKVGDTKTKTSKSTKKSTSKTASEETEDEDESGDGGSEEELELLLQGTTPVVYANVKPIIDKSCVSCHGAGSARGDLSTFAALQSKAEMALARMNGTGNIMPPANSSVPKPTPTEITLVQSWITGGKLQAAPATSTQTGTSTQTSTGTQTGVATGTKTGTDVAKGTGKDKPSEEETEEEEEEEDEESDEKESGKKGSSSKIDKSKKNSGC